jgi:threonine aldolase
MIDLRSDTVTRPDAAMRRAMAEAEVGDDVYGEDPTVRRLEEEAARAVGTEAALFVPSGTMGNQIALHLHARPGSEVVCEALAHVVHFEMGAMAAISGLLPRPVAAPRGLLTPELLAAALPPDVPYRSRAGVVVIENTHNLAGGVVHDRPRIDALLAVVRARGVPAHLDGARIFNAATALGTTAAALAAGFDTVMFSLSKGLGAPVGSMLCGGGDLMVEARRVRKMLGGGMRQAGVLAAAALLALRDGPARLAGDHAKARRLAAGLGEVAGLAVRLPVETNILMVRTAAPGGAAAFLERLRAQGVLAVPVGADELRFVTHRDVSEEQIERAIEAAGGAAA